MLFQKFLTYLNPATLFQKGANNLSLRAMHGVNRISIFMFLICLVVLVARWLA